MNSRRLTWLRLLILLSILFLSFPAVSQISLSEHGINEPEKDIVYPRAAQAPFAIVIATCDESLDWLFTSPSFSCSKYDIYIYDRCPLGNKTLSSPEMNSRLQSCTYYTALQNSSPHNGKSHEAFLTHILKKWTRLHKVTAFLKGTALHDHNKLMAMNEENSFISLAPDVYTDDFRSRRGRAIHGLVGKKKTYSEMALSKLRVLSLQNISLATQYISFRSIFSASSSQIYKNTEAEYRELLDFVLEGHNMTECDEQCSKLCPNCETIERLWSSILHCSDPFTPFHEAHEQPEKVWNDVYPKRCSTAAEPLIKLDVSYCEDPHSICFIDSVKDVIKQVYVAGILRLDLALSEKQSTYGRHIKYDKKHFVSKIRSQLGIDVLSEASVVDQYVVDPRDHTEEALLTILHKMNVGNVSKVSISNG